MHGEIRYYILWASKRWPQLIESSSRIKSMSMAVSTPTRHQEFSFKTSSPAGRSTTCIGPLYVHPRIARARSPHPSPHNSPTAGSPLPASTAPRRCEPDAPLNPQSTPFSPQPGLRQRPSRIGFSSAHHRRKVDPQPLLVGPAHPWPSHLWMSCEVTGRACNLGPRRLHRPRVLRARHRWMAPARSGSQPSPAPRHLCRP
jgi:hypothetical protein